MWPANDVGDVCMRPAVAVADNDPGLLLCATHEQFVGLDRSEPLCICGCSCTKAATPGKELCWVCWSSIKDIGAVAHLDRQEMIRAIR